MRWVVHVVRRGKMRNVHIKFWSTNLKGRAHLEDLGLDDKQTN